MRLSVLRNRANRRHGVKPSLERIGLDAVLKKVFQKVAGAIKRNEVRRAGRAGPQMTAGRKREQAISESWSVRRRDIQQLEAK